VRVDAANRQQGGLAPDPGFAIEDDTPGGIQFLPAIEYVFERNQAAAQRSVQVFMAVAYVDQLQGCL